MMGGIAEEDERKNSIRHKQIAGKYKYFWLSSKIILQTAEKRK